MMPFGVTGNQNHVEPTLYLLAIYRNKLASGLSESKNTVTKSNHSSTRLLSLLDGTEKKFWRLVSGLVQTIFSGLVLVLNVMGWTLLRSFDLVYSWGVIHHSEHPELIIGEIRRVLKPGGVFIGMMYGRHSPAVFKVWMKPYDTDKWPTWLSKYFPDSWGWFITLRAVK
jgi:SAM-dependent methyltransferase